MLAQVTDTDMLPLGCDHRNEITPISDEIQYMWENELSEMAPGTLGG